MANVAWYVVHVGKKPGIDRSWEDCYAQVKRYSGALHKKYDTEAAAVEVYHRFRSANHGQLAPMEIEEMAAIMENEEMPLIKDVGIRRPAMWSWKDVIIVFQTVVIAFLIWELM
jgi:hypothetical protein